MVPFLLPMAIVMIVLLATSLILFVRFFQLATPELALVRRDRSHPRPVLLAGGAFGSQSRFDRLVMSERDVVLDASGLVVTLRPRTDATSVLSIVERVGCDAANDPVRLGSQLDGVDSGSASDVRALVQTWVDERAPGFEVVAAVRRSR